MSSGDIVDRFKDTSRLSYRGKNRLNLIEWDDSVQAYTPNNDSKIVRQGDSSESSVFLHEMGLEPSPNDFGW